MTLLDGCTIGVPWINPVIYLVCPLQEGVSTTEKGSICGTIKSENTHRVSVCTIPHICIYIIAVRYIFGR